MTLPYICMLVKFVASVLVNPDCLNNTEQNSLFLYFTCKLLK